MFFTTEGEKLRNSLIHIIVANKSTSFFFPQINAFNLKLNFVPLSPVSNIAE